MVLEAPRDPRQRGPFVLAGREADVVVVAEGVRGELERGARPAHRPQNDRLVVLHRRRRVTELAAIEAHREEQNVAILLERDGGLADRRAVTIAGLFGHGRQHGVLLRLQRGRRSPEQEGGAGRVATPWHVRISERRVVRLRQ